MFDNYKHLVKSGDSWTMNSNPSKSILASFLQTPKNIYTTQDYSKFSNEQLLFILNALSGLAPYSHEFVAVAQDTQIVSGLVSAITSFMQELSGTKHTHWKTEYGPDTTLIVEGGEWAMGVLVVKRETGEARSKLRRIVKEFEDSFAVLKNADGMEGGAFSEFDQFVRRTFVGDRLSKRTVILKGYDWRNMSTLCESPRWSYGVRKLLTHVDNKKTLLEARNILRISLEEVKELVSRALWYRFIYVVHAPSDNDILMLSESAGSYLLDSHNPKGLSASSLKVIGALDGKSSLLRILRRLRQKNNEDMLIELGLLTNEGYIQRVSLERMMVLINECILTRILKKHSKIIGAKTVAKYLERAIKRTIVQIPWTARIECHRGFKVTCRLEEDLQISDLDQVSDALEAIQRDIAQQISQSGISVRAESILQGAMTVCREVWGTALRDLIV
jgi:hypothetical protein